MHTHVHGKIDMLEICDTTIQQKRKWIDSQFVQLSKSNLK